MAALEYREMRRKALEEARNKKNSLRQKDTLSNCKLDLTTSFTPTIRFDSPRPSIMYTENILPLELYQQVLAFCKTQQNCDDSGNSWKIVGGRKVMILGGIPHPNGAIVEELPPILKSLALSLAVFFDDNLPNQVLLNCYEVGQGIAQHNDGELYESQVAIISLQSAALIDFIRTTDRTGQDTPLSSELDSTAVCFKENECSALNNQFSILLESNSLLLFNGDAYTKYTHGIKATDRDIVDSQVLNASVLKCGSHQTDDGTVIIPRQDARYSLTFRRVKNIAVTLDEFGSCTLEMSNEIRRRKAWWLHAISDDK